MFPTLHCVGSDAVLPAAARSLYSTEQWLELLAAEYRGELVVVLVVVTARSVSQHCHNYRRQTRQHLVTRCHSLSGKPVALPAC